MRVASLLVFFGLVWTTGCRQNLKPAEPERDATAQTVGRPPFVVVDGGTQEADAGNERACLEDDREENDTQDTATAVVDGASFTAHFCGGDDDWYAIVVDDDDCAVAVTLVTQQPPNDDDGDSEEEDEEVATASPGLDDVDLLFVGQNGSVLGAATGLGARAALNVRVNRAGTYAVRVRGGDNGDVDYELTFGVTCGGDQVCPADDPYEPNDTSTTATLPDRGVAVDAAVCGADVDFWQLPVQDGCLADVKAAFVDERGDIDLFVQRRDTGAERARSAGTSNLERIRVLLDEPAGYVARVLLFNGADPATGNSYRLTVDQLCLTDLDCPGDDPFEDNDSRQTAKTIGKADATLGIVCGADEDYFRVIPQQGCTTTFFADFVHADGDVDLELLDGSGTRLARSTSTDDDEQIEYAASSSSAVVLRVFGFGDAQNRYRLTTTTTCP
jgi:hypothetical protein